MPDTDQDSGSLWSKIKDLVPYVASAGIGGALGGPAGAVAALGGTGQAEFKAEELKEQRASRMSDVLLQVQQRREAMKARQQDLEQHEADRQQQAQFMNTMRTRDQQDKEQWKSFQQNQATLHEQDMNEWKREHEQDVQQSQANLNYFRNLAATDRTKRTDALLKRSDAQVERLNLLNNALVGEKKDYDTYVKTLPDDLQKEAAAFGHTPTARTAFMKEMQKREQAEDPVRRDALIGHAASLLGKDPDDLKTEWAGY